MRFLPTRLHAIIDYVWGVALLASPWILDFADVPAARWIAVVFGPAPSSTAPSPPYELGLVPVLPMPLHLVLDGVAGFILAIAPWGFGFAERVFWPFVLFGLFSVAASLVTRLQPARSPGHRSGHAVR